MSKSSAEYKVAVLLPCYNEEITIGQTIDAFKKALPFAQVYVYDNCSTDNTKAVAASHGAIVRFVAYQGKGHVVRQMFADVESDIYVLCDADATYDAMAAQTLIQTLIDEHLDMVVGSRQEDISQTGIIYRKGHRFGNRLFTWLVAKLFGNRFQDILSGYRVFSRRFVKSFPALSKGFDTETELTIHALELKLPVAEIPTAYKSRPEHSVSKLRSYRDGWVILKRIILMLKETKPFLFFGTIASFFVLSSMTLAFPILLTYLNSGLVPRVPTVILSASLLLIAFVLYALGLILHSVSHKHLEVKQLTYLRYPSIN
jgi:glycosyltransferase involved in cell wall biosynthesis